MAFPKKLVRENLFVTPTWYVDAPNLLPALIKATNPYIKKSKQHFKKSTAERNKRLGSKNDIGIVYHSTTLIGDHNLHEFSLYVVNTANNLLTEMGHDLTNHQTFLTELWVQEFPKSGGGMHDLHTHWNGHISGFYFLKCSARTSMPVFEDPRPGAMINSLPQKDKNMITFAATEAPYKIVPGRFIFFPSYLPHKFILDLGLDDFRFIHFNCQTITKGVYNVVQKK